MMRPIEAPPSTELSAEHLACLEADFVAWESDPSRIDWAGPTEATAAEVVEDGLAVLDQRLSLLVTDLAVMAARLSPGQIVHGLHRLEMLRRRLPALEHLLVTQVTQRAIHDDYAQPSTAALLVSELTITPGEARKRVKAAEALGPRVAFDGQPLTSCLELVAEAQARGQLSEGHVTVIRKAMRLLPPDLEAVRRDEAECALVGHAVGLHSDDLAHAARRLLDHLDPDGREPAAERAHRLRDVTLWRRQDGSGVVRGSLTHETTTALETVLDSLSAPVPEHDGLRDERSPGQRRHDGLLTLCQMALRSGGLPDSGGVPATIIVRVDADDLAGRSGDAQTAHGAAWPIKDMLTSIGDQARWVTVYGSDTDGVLAYGTDRRFATAAQTSALIARDGGCTFPGCTIPAAWTQRHHVIPVVPVNDGDPPGRTDLQNLTLLCGYHHRTFGAAGWTCHMLDGRPHWTPPAWIDPDQTPRRNTHWDTASLS